MSATCARERLAHGPGVTVERCRCGTVHLTIAAVTVRLERGAFLVLARALEAAADRLATTTEHSVAPPRPAALTFAERRG